MCSGLPRELGNGVEESTEMTPADVEAVTQAPDKLVEWGTCGPTRTTRG